MKYLSRRAFVRKSAMGLGGAWALSQIPGLLRARTPPGFSDFPIGFQTFPVRDRLAKDFAGTLRTMAGFGYQVLEMCSPPGYVGAGFGFLINMKAAELRSTISDAGLTCPSCHFTFTELTDKLDDRIEFAQQLGLTQMICSSFWLPATATIKDYQDASDKLNMCAEKIKKAGMQTGYHNHEMEFATRDGELIYDAIMSRLDPQLVKMQFQTEVINLGYKAATYFTKYHGRFISSPLSDWTAEKKEVPIGQGIIDWKGFFAAAKTGGVKNIFVEMDFDKFKDSAAYLRSL
ncbi:MAG: TIM barrel protein [Bacteroidota bacterium]|nr:TIM barrel protein [Bacteroidota bacterium]